MLFACGRCPAKKSKLLLHPCRSTFRFQQLCRLCVYYVSCFPRTPFVRETHLRGKRRNQRESQNCKNLRIAMVAMRLKTCQARSVFMSQVYKPEAITESNRVPRLFNGILIISIISREHILRRGVVTLKLHPAPGYVINGSCSGQTLYNPETLNPIQTRMPFV